MQFFKNFLLDPYIIVFLAAILVGYIHTNLMTPITYSAPPAQITEQINDRLTGNTQNG